MKKSLASQHRQVSDNLPLAGLEGQKWGKNLQKLLLGDMLQ